jgi:polyferredoxin
MKILSSKKYRIFIQMGFLILVTVASFLHQKVGGGPEGVASIHAICPFGGLESFYSFFINGSFIKKTYYSNLVLIGGTTFITIFFGRIFCGWICALGTLQDIFGKIGLNIFKKRRQVPESMDKPLRIIKYFVFVGILYFTWRTGELVISTMDPFAAYSHIPAGIEEVMGEYIIGFSILLLMLFSSLMYDRLFCRYLCPLGAYYAVINRISIFKINRREDLCIECDKCNKICPAAIDISHKESVAKAECFSCMECVSACPTKEKSLETSSGKKIINFKNVGILGVAVFIMIVFLTKITGIYSTNPNSLKDILNGNPSNIRGWMSISDVSEGFDIPKVEIYNALGVSPQELPDDMSIKDSEAHLENQGIDFNHDKVGETVGQILGKKGLKVEKSPVTFSFRGHMTITEISSITGLSPEDVIEKLELPEDIPVDRPLKEMGEEYNYDIGVIKSKAEKDLISN